MSLEIQIKTSTGTVCLDLSREECRKELLQTLENDGWVIFKKATDINSSERAKLHEVFHAYNLQGLLHFLIILVCGSSPCFGKRW